MNTRHKIFLAGILYRIVHALRRAFGRNDQTEVERAGIAWKLDLSEGIDFSIYLLGVFESTTVAAYRKCVQQGDTVVDIGANIGAHTLHLARCVGPAGRVIAFEPTTYAYNKLLANIALNPELAPSIHTEQAALVNNIDTPLPSSIYSSWRLTTSAPNQHAKHLGTPMDTAGARLLTLDQYMEEANIKRIHFIKLDVDGYECSVLRGAVRTLKRDKPTLLMELMPYGLDETGTSLEQLLDVLNSAGYRMLNLDGTSLPSDYRVLNHIPSAGSINILCRP